MAPWYDLPRFDSLKRSNAQIASVNELLLGKTLCFSQVSDFFAQFRLFHLHFKSQVILGLNLKTENDLKVNLARHSCVIHLTFIEYQRLSASPTSPKLVNIFPAVKESVLSEPETCLIKRTYLLNLLESVRITQ